MKTPLNEIWLKCADCGDEYDGEQINAHNPMFHDPNTGNGIRLPSFGITTEDEAKLKSMGLICELCHEDREDKRNG